MANELAQFNQKSLSKNQLGSYVHAAKELEKDIYTLEETEKQLMDKAKQLRTSKPNVPYPDFESENIERPKRPENDKEDKKSCAISALIFSGIVALILIVIGGGIIGDLADETDSTFLNKIFESNGGIYIVWLIGLVLSILPGVIFYWRARKQSIKKYRAKTKNYEYTMEKIRKNNAIKSKEYEKAIKKAEESYAISCSTALKIEKQAKEVHTKANELKQIRNTFYSVDVIPPDYRTMDCVYVLDQIFRNDLADTMRQAISIYEERAFRGDVIRGMGMILSKLDSLQGTMGYLVNDLNSVKENVSFMSQDVYRMAEAQSKHNEKMLENSKATRYAAETVQKHSEEAKKYFGF